jgi:hypothetical protein
MIAEMKENLDEREVGGGGEAKTGRRSYAAGGQVVAVTAVQEMSVAEGNNIQTVRMQAGTFQSMKLSMAQGSKVGTEVPISVPRLKQCKKEEVKPKLFDVADLSDEKEGAAKEIGVPRFNKATRTATRKRKIFVMTGDVPVGGDVIAAGEGCRSENKGTSRRDDASDNALEDKTVWDRTLANQRAGLTQIDGKSLRLLQSKSKNSFELLGWEPKSVQQQLVKEAFSLGGEEGMFFCEEKKIMVEAGLPQFEDKAIPGWGSWGGAREVAVKPLSKAKLQAKAAVERKAREVAKSRSDAKLNNVFISDKVDKKALKYMVPRLPYPFTSVEQFDRRQRTPIGSEWNTINTFQNAIKPSVISKPGVIIKPIEQPRSSKRPKKEVK